MWVLAFTYIHQTRNRFWGITCNHVLKEDQKYFVGAQRLDQPKIPANDFHTVPEVSIIQRFPDDDLAFFHTNGVDLSGSRKSPIDILQSSVITLDRLQRNLKNAMMIFGVPGFLAEFTPIEANSIYAELPIYTALGPVVEVDENTLVGDFTEREVLFKNTNVFPKLADVQATGGSRDLSGMSGSGGWIKASEGILVVGILAGPKEATNTVHLIRFVPIWKVVSALKAIST